MTSDESIPAQASGREAGAVEASERTEVSTSETTPPGSALLVHGAPHSGADDASAAVRLLSQDSPLASLPMHLNVTVPIPEFRVHSLLALQKGSVLESGWTHTEDVPVWCGGVQLVWAEFDVVDQKLAVRVTRIG